MFDSIGFSIVLLSGFWGLWSGGIKQAYKLLLLALTVALVMLLFPFLKGLCGKRLPEGVLLNVLSGVAAYLCAALITSLLESYLPCPEVSGIDRVIGLLIGMVKGIAICLLLLSAGLILSTGSYSGSESALDVLDKVLAASKPQWYQSSSLAALLSKGMSSLYSALGPEAIRALLVKIKISPFNPQK